MINLLALTDDVNGFEAIRADAPARRRELSRVQFRRYRPGDRVDSRAGWAMTMTVLRRANGSNEVVKGHCATSVERRHLLLRRHFTRPTTPPSKPRITDELKGGRLISARTSKLRVPTDAPTSKIEISSLDERWRNLLRCAP